MSVCSSRAWKQAKFVFSAFSIAVGFTHKEGSYKQEKNVEVNT